MSLNQSASASNLRFPTQFVAAPAAVKPYTCAVDRAVGESRCFAVVEEPVLLELTMSMKCGSSRKRPCPACGKDVMAPAIAPQYIIERYL